MTDEEREALIRQHVKAIQSMAPYDAENVQGHVTFLLRIIDGLREQVAQARRQGREQMREEALSRIPATSELANAIRALPLDPP